MLGATLVVACDLRVYLDRRLFLDDARRVQERSRAGPVGANSAPRSPKYQMFPARRGGLKLKCGTQLRRMQ